MRKVFKWIGIVLGSLVGLIVVSAVVLYLMGNVRLNKKYEVAPSDITLPADAASLEYGKHRAETLCEGCHGADLSGVEGWFNAPPIGTIDSANLTSGKGGVGAEFTTEDYVRAIRHGIDREGKPIFMTAVVSTAHLSDEDLGAIIAYLKTIPAVDHQLKPRHFTPMARILLSVGVLGKLPAEAVSHDIHVTAPPRGTSAEYGEYLVNTNDCRVCHGQKLNGGPYPNPTITKISPNLTPGGEPGFWTEDQFINTIRTGKTPGGHALDPEFMPWKNYRLFSDAELKAIWLYLQSLPKLPQYTK
ncbi:MAG TPA: c-type cytochrome [Anaerolineales bacterium]|nr:c-type cytochrome [Anaerolineales bacterium]